MQETPPRIRQGDQRISLTFVTPECDAVAMAYREDLAFLYHFLPFQADPVDEYLANSLPHLTLIYANDIIVGAFVLVLWKRTAELSGVIRPDLNTVFPGRGKRLKLKLFDIVLDAVFEGPGAREKLICKVPPESKGGRGFAWMYGFKKLPNIDKGRTVWKLEKINYELWKTKKEHRTRRHGTIPISGD